MNGSLYNLPVPLPFNLLRNITRVNPLIINYHVVSDNRLPHIENLYKYRNIKSFSEDLDFLSKKYHPIQLRELLESLKYKTELPKNSLLLTFDDGFREVYDVVAPILIRKKLAATLFLTRNFVDNQELNYDNKKSLIIDRIKAGGNQSARKLSALLKTLGISGKDHASAILGIPVSKRPLVDELAQELGLDFSGFLSEVKPYMTTMQIEQLHHEGFTFGGHGIDHANFAELPVEDQVKQTLESVGFVTNMLNLNYRVFAFPYSDRRVTLEYFNTISDKIDASFGTQGLLTDSVVNNLQRTSVEKLPFAIKKTLKQQYLRRQLYQYMNKLNIKR